MPGTYPPYYIFVTAVLYYFQANKTQSNMVFYHAWSL